MAGSLDAVLRHDLWANQRLFEFVRGLDPATLARHIPGTYGTLHETLLHIVSGEQWYVQLLTGERIGAEVVETEPRPLAELLDIVTRTGERAIELARRDDGDRRVAVDDKTWPASIIYAQLVHHGNEHRGQVKSILGASGIEPPGVSAWGYAMDEARRDGA